MSAASMQGRIAKVEDGGRGGVVVAWKHIGEASEAACQSATVIGAMLLLFYAGKSKTEKEKAPRDGEAKV